MSKRQRYLFELYEGRTLDLCEASTALRGHAIGSSYGLSLDDLDRMAVWLRARIVRWTPSVEHRRRYEDAVKELVLAALDAWDTCDWRRR